MVRKLDVTRFLVIDHRVATPDRDAGSLRMVNLLRVLDLAGHPVTYLPQTLEETQERSRYVALAEVVPFRRADETRVTRHLHSHRRSYDVAILCRPGPTATYLRRIRRWCPETRIVYDTVDLHHLRELRQAEVEQDRRGARRARAVRRRELELVGAADATVVVSTTEATLLRREFPTALIQVISTIHATHPTGPSFQDRDGLVFLAGFEHAPNVDAAHWLVEEIMPLVWHQRSDLRLTLVGSHPPPPIAGLAGPRVTVTGAVPSVTPWLEQARLSLAPVRFGSGVKGKVSHSMAAGLPVIATSMACEGMPIQPDRDILVADEPEGFAQAVLRAYDSESLWGRLADHGRLVAATHFSFAAARRAVDNLLESLLSHTGHGIDPGQDIGTSRAP